MKRELINANNDDTHEALEACQKKYDNNDAQKDPSVYLKGATVAIQHEDGEPWMYRVMVESNGSNHRGHSYTI